MATKIEINRNLICTQFSKTFMPNLELHTLIIAETLIADVKTDGQTDKLSSVNSGSDPEEEHIIYILWSLPGLLLPLTCIYIFLPFLMVEEYTKITLHMLVAGPRPVLRPKSLQDSPLSYHKIPARVGKVAL